MDGKDYYKKWHAELGLDNEDLTKWEDLPEVEQHIWNESALGLQLLEQAEPEPEGTLLTDDEVYFLNQVVLAMENIRRTKNATLDSLNSIDSDTLLTRDLNAPDFKLDEAIRLSMCLGDLPKAEKNAVRGLKANHSDATINAALLKARSYGWEKGVSFQKGDRI